MLIQKRLLTRFEIKYEHLVRKTTTIRLQTFRIF